MLTDKDFADAGDRHGAVLLAIGAASMCWEHPDRAEVFQDQRAAQIAADLIRYLGLAP